MEATVQDEIESIKMERPHVVILGAGASIASCPNGDKNGKKLPSMDNFCNILQLDDILNEWNIDSKLNFEDIYSDIHLSGELDKLKIINEKVFDYFNNLELQNEPTIYDHLILSLRSKDLIATFNWDPFLLQAYIRNKDSGLSLPKIVFLHGNVMVGYCKKDKIWGLFDQQCSKCKKSLERVDLLYPIKNKNYSDDLFISGQWDILKYYIKNSFMITIFGYSGPKTDKEAIDLMSDAWGPNQNREMEQVDFITKPGFNEYEISENWDKFIHSHHYDIVGDFYESWIANHPRRTGEAYLNQYLEAKFIENNPIPQKLGFYDLWKWYEKLKKVEDSKFL